MRTAIRKAWVLAAALAVGAGTMAAQAHTWVIDKNHSEADFSVKHMGMSTVNGSFHGVTGTIRFDPVNPGACSVTATIDVSTVGTGVAARDQDLKSAKFFNAAQDPTMTFKSTNVRAKNSYYLVQGNLTLHGVTKPVTLTLDSPGGEKVGMDATHVHKEFKATTTINRQDFGLTWNGTMKSGDSAIGNEVNIKLDIEAVRQ